MTISVPWGPIAATVSLKRKFMLRYRRHETIIYPVFDILYYYILLFFSPLIFSFLYFPIFIPSFFLSIRHLLTIFLPSTLSPSSFTSHLSPSRHFSSLPSTYSPFSHPLPHLTSPHLTSRHRWSGFKNLLWAGVCAPLHL